MYFFLLIYQQKERFFNRRKLDSLNTDFDRQFAKYYNFLAMQFLKQTQRVIVMYTIRNLAAEKIPLHFSLFRHFSTSIE